MLATTIGTGPFKPAISFNGRMWVLELPHDNEDLAQKVAQTALTKAIDMATRSIANAGFDVYGS